MQGLNLNETPGISFVGKLSHWLKGGVWVAFTFYPKKPFPASNTFLVAFPDQRNGWFLAGFSRPWLNIFKGFSLPLAMGFSCPWIKMSVGVSFLSLSIAPNRWYLTTWVNLIQVYMLSWNIFSVVTRDNPFS